jgi:hypothetical protein
MRCASMRDLPVVVPANAGTQRLWRKTPDSRVRGNDGNRLHDGDVRIQGIRIIREYA